MKTFTVVAQSHPTRCEVCHQTDQFDPENGQCARCCEILTEYNQDNSSMFPIVPAVRREVLEGVELIERARQCDISIAILSMQVSNGKEGSLLFIGFFVGILSVLATLSYFLPQCSLWIDRVFLSILFLSIPCLFYFFTSNVINPYLERVSLMKRRDKILANPKYPAPWE